MTEADQTVKMNKTTASQFLDGQTIVVNLEAGHYYGLDEVGSRMWELISEYSSSEKVIALLLEEFDVEEDKLRSDFREFLEKLQKAEVISVRSESTAS